MERRVGRTTRSVLVSGTAALVLGVSVGSSVGCDSHGEKFDGAPRAEAPPPEEVDQPGLQNRGSGESSGERDDLPAGHPPVTGSRTERTGGGGAGSQPGGAGSAPDRAEETTAGSGGAPRKSGPLRWSLPDAWTPAEPSTEMRLVQYRAPGAKGEKPATMAVFHFGSGGGSIQANIDRWIGQFDPGEGTSPKEAAEIDQRTVDGMQVHTVDVAGRYDPGMSGGGPEPDQRMLAAIVETSKGPYFFKMVGPTSTVARHESAFETFVASFERP